MAEPTDLPEINLDVADLNRIALTPAPQGETMISFTLGWDSRVGFREASPALHWPHRPILLLQPHGHLLQRTGHRAAGAFRLPRSGRWRRLR